MIKSFDDFCRLFLDLPPPLDKWQIRYLTGMLRTYNRSKVTAENFGFVGVGCITFAENRLQQFQKRVAARMDRRNK